MKKLFIFAFVLLIAPPISKFAFADEPGNKGIVKKTERDAFWHQFYLGLEEDKSGGMNVNKRANQFFFEKIKAFFKNPGVLWPDISFEFSQDSATAPYLVIFSVTRFPNGRIKEVAANYIQKSPRYEHRMSLFGGSKHFRDSYYANNVADYIAISLPDIKREVEYRATKAVFDSALARRKGETLLSGMGRITGKVVDSLTNRPINGAEVEIGFQYTVYPQLGTKTNENGHFEILNLPPGDWNLTINYNCSQSIHNVGVKENQTVSIETVKLNAIPVGDGQITGQVLDSKTNEPLQGARVRLLCPNGIPAKLGAVTDEKGNFYIEKVPPRIYQIEISYGPVHSKQLIKNFKIEENQTLSIGVVKLVERRVEEDTLNVKSSYR